MEQKRVYTPKEVMEILHLSKNAVYAALQNGEIYAVHIGDRWLIPMKSLDKMLSGEKPVNVG
jgi:excisionase family DNA binding protein